MNIKIRSERVSDYNSIANVNYEAFLGWDPGNQYVAEHILVDLLRHNSLFDPELSLVAEHDGEVVGHALFSPFKFIILGVEQSGVVLGPIAIKPGFQRKGIGGMLIEEGHRIAREKGFTFSMLCGHADYYPRFGYKQGMFSLSGVKVSIAMDEFCSEGYAERAVKEQDLKWILDAWESSHKGDTLALFPGTNISEWSNHGHRCRSTVVLKGEEPIGYLRYFKSNPIGAKEVLSINGDITDLLAYHAWKHYGKAQGDIYLALAADKVNAGINGADTVKIVDQQAGSKFYMIKVLDDMSPISRYCEQVEKGLLTPGIIVFPPIYDIGDGEWNK